MNEQFSFDTLSGVDFELYLKSIFENLGYEVDLTPASNDYGADLIISKEQTKTVIQAKRYNKPVGKSAIQEILGAISYYNADSGIVVTNNYFTPNAINLANSAHIALWDRDVLIKQALNSFNPNNNSNKGSVQLDIDVLSLIEDLDNIHHLLIVGAMSSGKTSLLHGIIKRLLQKNKVDSLKLLLIDTKAAEFANYNGIPPLLIPVVTDPRKAIGALSYVATELNNRYKTFADNSVRSLKEYNNLFFADTSQLISIPRIVIVIDELQDLMTTIKADAESVLREIALKGSKAGIYMIAATQNFQIEKSLNNLFPSLAYLSVKQQYMIDLRILHNEAINARLPIVEWNNILEMIAGLKEQDSLAYSKDIFDELDKHSNSQCQENESEFDDDDEILTQAIECVIESGQASTSQLQRRLKLGYARAARIIDQLEGKGIVGPFEGSKPRQVLISKDKWLEMKSGGTQGLPGFECEVTAKVKKEVISKANAGGNEPPLIDWNDNDKLDSEDIAMSLALSDDDKNASSPKQKGKPSSGCLVSILTFIGVMVFLIMWLI